MFENADQLCTILKDNFSPEEVADLRDDFEKQDFVTINIKLNARGIIAEGDRQDIMEALAGGDTRIIPGVLARIISDFDKSNDKFMTRDINSLLKEVMNPTQREPVMRGWRLDIAIPQAVKQLQGTGAKITKENFRILVQSIYTRLQSI